MEKQPKKPRAPATAKSKLMDYLARREHSELELQQKLERNFPEDEVQAALQEAKRQGWIPNSTEAETELAERTAAGLQRRQKGALWINQFLQEKGLPEIPVDEEVELAKAQELVKNKFRSATTDEPMRIARFLTSRGFPEAVIRKVIEQWKKT